MIRRTAVRSARAGLRPRMAAALLGAPGLALLGLTVAGCASPGTTTGSARPASGSNSAHPAHAQQSQAQSSQAAAVSGAAEYPDTLGDTWTYSSTFGGQRITIMNKVVKVVPAAGGQRVVMRDRNSSLKGVTRLVFLFHSDGAISFPFSELGGKTARVISGSLTWPSDAQLASGQPDRTVVVYSIPGVGRLTMHLVIRGAGTQKVTVPAGTYQAQTVVEQARERIDGKPLTIRAKYWLAPGVGPVKSTTGVGSGEVLTSFHKG